MAGGVDRDSTRVVQFIFSTYKGYHTNNFMEALATLSSLEMCYAFGLWKIINESDSQDVVDMLNGGETDNKKW